MNKYQGLANSGLWAKPGLPLVFIKKSFIETQPPTLIHVHGVSGCLSAAVPELSNYSTDTVWPAKGRYLLSGPLQKSLLFPALYNKLCVAIKNNKTNKINNT